MTSHPLNKKGFTLLEVMIAVTILAFISLFTSNMISQGAKAKKKIQNEIDRTSSLTTALQLISRDIELAFNYRDINAELHNIAQNERMTRDEGKNPGAAPPPPPAPAPTPAPPAPPPPPPQSVDPEGYKMIEIVIHSQFIGEKDKLDFTTLNNFRSTKNSEQSDQAEVGYFLDNCSGRINKESSSQCLWRRVSPYLDEDVTDGGAKTVLIENVKSLQFRYIGPGHEEKWVETWKTKDGEEITKNKFPTAVEVTLVILDTNFKPAKEVAMTIVASLRFPNNKVDAKSAVVN